MILDDTVHIGIVGSRRRDGKADFMAVRKAFIELLEEYRGRKIVIVSGECKTGGDKFARWLRDEFGMAYIGHPPDESDMDPKKNRRFEYARVAYARNTLIARDSDILIACVASDRTGGTEDTVRKFIKMGKKEHLVLV